MYSISEVQAYVRLTRPRNALGGLLTYSIGYFISASTLNLDYLTGLIILLVLHSLATIQNDIEDFEIDRANDRKNALHDRSLSLTNAGYFLWALAIVAVSLALVSPRRTLFLSVFAGLILLAGLYNLNPARASKRPIVSIVLMGLCYGALPLVYGYLVAGGDLKNIFFIAMALLWFLVRFSTSIMKDYKDAKGDRLYGKNTFYLNYGAKVTAWTSVITAAAGYAGITIALATLNSRSIVFYAALAAAVLLAYRGLMLRFKLTKTTDEKKLNAIFYKSVLGQNQFEGAALLCLILSSR